jgi:hypothetical protein
MMLRSIIIATALMLPATAFAQATPADPARPRFREAPLARPRLPIRRHLPRRLRLQMPRPLYRYQRDGHDRHEHRHRSGE